MKVDKTTTVGGGELYNLNVEQAQIVAVLDPAPLYFTASVAPTTVSISQMLIGGGVLEPPPTPEPDPDVHTYYGEPTTSLGFGGAPPYLTCYPLQG